LAEKPLQPIDKGMAGPGLLAHVVTSKYADHLPLYQVMIDRVLLSHVIGTDDTILPMLAPEKANQARVWVYLGDEDHPYNVFDFTLSRSRDGPAIFLKNYDQALLADA
jgi:hypothetical protein